MQGIIPTQWPGQDLCCGGAGNYFLNHRYDSEEILNLKYEQLLKYDFEYLVTANPGCYLQLEKGRQIYDRNFEIIHFIEIVDILLSN